MAKKQRLTMRIGRNQLSFSTIEMSDEGKARVVYEPYTVRSGVSMAANMREAFKTATLLGGTYQRVHVMVDSPVLVVPIEVYDEACVTPLYDHSFLRDESHTVLPCVLPTLNAVALFAMSRDLRLVIDDHFANAKYMCVAAPVWRHLQQRSYTGLRRKLYGYFHDKRLDVFAFGQNRFKFYNTFDTSLPHDALYFLLYVWRQLQMDCENDELHIAGDIPDRESVLSELRRYVQRAYAINPVGDFNRSPVTQIKAMPYDLMTYYVKGR